MRGKELYSHMLSGLQQVYSSSEAQHISSMLLESVAGISRSDLAVNPAKELSETTQQQLLDALARLLEHEPIQYILGEAWFYKLKFKVSPAVLIPRPETEELVAEVISFLRDKPAALVLDIGTGSGCIPVAIKKNLPGITMDSIDISPESLDIARENASAYGLQVNFTELDFLNEKKWELLKEYDAIVSNPPYIPVSGKEQMEPNVTVYEPSLALFVPDEQPLIFYEQIAAFGKQHLKPGGKIFLETHEAFAGLVAELFNNSGYNAIILKDISAKDRIVLATRSLKQ